MPKKLFFVQSAKFITKYKHYTCFFIYKLYY